MRHDPMDWTVGTFGTVGNDALDAGDSWERRRPGGICALSASLALGWYVSRFQRFCRFAARDAGRASGRMLASGDGAG